jgi:hypothetical protein
MRRLSSGRNIISSTSVQTAFCARIERRLHCGSKKSSQTSDSNGHAGRDEYFAVQRNVSSSEFSHFLAMLNPCSSFVSTLGPAMRAFEILQQT